MFLRLLNRVLYAPEGPTTEGAIAAMNTALEEAGVPATGGEGDGDAGGAGGEGAGGEGGDPGSQERGGAGDGDAGAGADGAGEGDESKTPEELAAAAEAAKGGKGAQGDPPDPEADRGDGRNAAGRFAKKKDETEEQLAARRAADPDDGKKPGEGKGKKTVDHVNDPIPDEIKGRTRERIEGLAATAKDLTAKLTAANTELEQARDLVSMIDATGADPETFARHMDVLALMHSTDVGDKQQVHKYLRAAAEKIGAELGETPTGKDPLEGHADLLEEVEAGETTRARAEEIAKFRNQAAAAERLRTTESTRRTETEAAERKRVEVKSALNGLTAELRKKDGDAAYLRKHKLLVPFIKRLNGKLPTDQIVQAVREAYAAIELPAAPQPNGNGSNRAPAGTGGQQPMRHRQGAGGGQIKQPSSALEAMEGALEELATGGAR